MWTLVFCLVLAHVVAVPGELLASSHLNTMVCSTIHVQTFTTISLGASQIQAATGEIAIAKHVRCIWYERQVLALPMAIVHLAIMQAGMESLLQKRLVNLNACVMDSARRYQWYLVKMERALATVKTAKTLPWCKGQVHT